MKTTTYLKVGALAALGVCTWLITSSIVAGTLKVSKASSAPAQAFAAQIGGQPSVSKRQMLPGEAIPAGVPLNGDGLYELGNFRVTPDTGKVTVDCGITVVDRRVDRPDLMWTVTITDQATGEVVATVPYLDKVFSLEAGEIQHPTFHDVFALAPGEYEVALQLNGIPQGGTVPNDVLLSDFDVVTVK